MPTKKVGDEELNREVARVVFGDPEFHQVGIMGHFSADEDYALLIVRKMAEKGFVEFELTYIEKLDPSWRASFQNRSVSPAWGAGSGQEPMTAICQAAVNTLKHPQAPDDTPDRGWH